CLPRASPFTVIPPPPSRSPLFPYTTLFRSEPPWHASRSAPYASGAFAAISSRSAAEASTLIGFRAASAFRRCSSARRGITRHRRSEEHTSELQSLTNLVCRLLLEKKKQHTT